MLGGIEVEVNFADGLVLPVIENDSINMRLVRAHETVLVDFTETVDEYIEKTWLIIKTEEE